MRRTEEVKLLQKVDGSDKNQGSVATFFPQELKEPPRSSEHGSKEEGSRSSKELDMSEESRSSKELNVTEGCINQQVKEKEVDDLKDPGEITEPGYKEKKESREK